MNDIRLRAVHLALAPAAIGCYKLLSFVQDTSSILLRFYYACTSRIMTDFEGVWVQKWVQSSGTKRPR